MAPGKTRPSRLYCPHPPRKQAAAAKNTNPNNAPRAYTILASLGSRSSSCAITAALKAGVFDPAKHLPAAVYARAPHAPLPAVKG
jgi:hypothetical protein